MERMMATFERSIPETDPAGVAVAWQDALTAMGWEQTEDTGQLDPATEPFQSVAGDPWGFQCWRPGDGLGGLIVKIAWSRGSGTSATYPTVGFEIGAATEGSGEFVGNSWAASSIQSTSLNPAVPQTLLMGGDSSGFYAAMGPNRDHSGTTGAGLRGAVIVDRSRDANGEPSTDGAAFLHNLGSSSTTIQVGKPGTASWTYGRASQGIPLYPLYVAAAADNLGGSFSPDSSSTPVFPSVLAGEGVPTWVSPLFVGVHPNDTPPGLTADIAGRSRYYRRVRTGPIATSSTYSSGLAMVMSGTASNTSAWPMMLWED